MLYNLRDAIELRDTQIKKKRIHNKPEPQVNIYRQIRYFAEFNGVTYDLVSDWYNEAINEKLDTLDRETNKPNSKG